MLKIKAVSKTYGSERVLKQISLSIPKGRCFGLVGPNGAGKSTLIKIIANIIHDFKGEVQFNDPIIRKSPKRYIGYVPQEICLEQTVSAQQNLNFFGKLYGLKGKQLQERTEEVLSYIGLTSRKKDKVETFSGGMKRRLNIGCALIHQPKIMIMDEPTVGIDPQSRKYIFDIIKHLKKTGCTIIYTSHYMEEVEELCDEVAFIDKGNVIEEGQIESLIKRYSIPSIYIKGENCLPEDAGQFGTISNKKDGYVIITKNPLYAMERIIQHCRDRENKLDRLELVQPRLEDIFFTLTGKKLRDNK